MIKLSEIQSIYIAWDWRWDSARDYAHEFWEENKAPVCPAMVDLGNPF
jgi:hypothetical protein